MSDMSFTLGDATEAIKLPSNCILTMRETQEMGDRSIGDRRQRGDKGDRRQGDGDRETGDRRQETGDRR